MARYRAVFDDSQSGVLHALARDIDGYEDRLKSIAGGIDSRDYTMRTLRNQVRSSADALQHISRRMRGEGAAWDRSVGIYKKAEQDAAREIGGIGISPEFMFPGGLLPRFPFPHPFPGFPAVWDWLIWRFDQFRPFLPFLPLSPPIIVPGIISLLTRSGWSIGTNVPDFKIPPLSDFLLGQEKIEDTNTWLQLTNGAAVLSLLTSTVFTEMESGKGQFRKWEPEDFKKYYTHNGDANFAKQKGGVNIYGIGGGIEGSLLEGKYTGEYGSAGAKFGTAEAHWGADAGMYQYDKNGNRFWSPRVSAEVGASASVFEMDAEGKLLLFGSGTETESDDFGFQGEGEISVGKIEGKLEAKSVLFDQNGNFKPELKVSGSAEAIAAQAEGSAGINVAGIEGNVTGKIGFGVGAHADVGFTDGKFKVDIGAYVGVGGSVGFEIDAGGAVDAVCEGGKAVIDFLSPPWW